MRSLVVLLSTILLLATACAGQRPVLTRTASADDRGIAPGKVDPPCPTPSGRPAPSYASRALNVEVAPWYGFHRAALSLTFDDGTLDQYLLAFPELERRNLKATFFILTGYLDQGFWQDSGVRRSIFGWEQAREMAVRGHEIGSHGCTHDELLEGGSRVKEELADSRKRIDREIPNRRCVSFSWPFWRSDESSRKLAAEHYIAARSGGAAPELYAERNDGVPAPVPADILQIGAMGILSGELERWREAGDAAYHRGGWIVLCLHGIDDGEIRREALGWRPVAFASFTLLLDHLSAYDLWIAPFGDIARYIHERDSFSMRLLERTDRRIVLQLTDGLNDDIFDLPLSFRVRIPKEWEGARALQAGRLVPAVMETGGSIAFEAVPDAGLITIVRNSKHP